MPFAKAVIFVIVGFVNALTKPFGPVKLTVPPLAVKVNELPIQTGELLNKTAVGVFTTVTLEVAVAVHPKAEVTVTV